MSEKFKSFFIWLGFGSLAAIAIDWVFVEMHNDYDPFLMIGTSIGLVVGIAICGNWFPPISRRNPYSLIAIVCMLAGAGLGQLAEVAWRALN